MNEWKERGVTPCSLRSKALTEESTPPDMATTIRTSRAVLPLAASATVCNVRSGAVVDDDDCDELWRVLVQLINLTVHSLLVLLASLVVALGVQRQLPAHVKRLPHLEKRFVNNPRTDENIHQ